jgi:UDP-N-acetylmuramoyl-L-alanyl-D-glutamate--2,6-diaminopimelate ligase
MMALVAIRHPWRLADLLEGVAEVPAGEILIAGLALDSRALEPGSLFLACRGGSGHGLDFAEEAVRRGAVAIAAEPGGPWDAAAMTALAARLRLPVIPVEGLGRKASAVADRFFGEPSAALDVTGITGTNGKTSVSHFLAQALAPEVPCGIVGTLGSGFPGDLAPGIHTTPDPVRLQETLAWLRARGAGAVAMEVSSHALDQGRADAVRFRHAVFTNLSRDHLDYHGDMTAYGAAKRRLFLMPGLAWAVVNADDPLSAEILADLGPGVRSVLYSIRPEAGPREPCNLWVQAREVVPGPAGLRITVETSRGGGTLEAGVLGRFNAANLMAVLGVLLARGLSVEAALHALAGVQGVAGRMERFGGDALPLVVVDYAHTPDALEQVLGSLREHCRGRLFCVFGAGGERDRGKRPLMGAIAERLADQVIVTDDNPRRENGERIVAEILAGMQRPNRVQVERQRSLAIRLAIARAATGDLILVAGKGHETTQDMGELKVHFSDRAQVQQALAERRGGAAGGGR